MLEFKILIGSIFFIGSLSLVNWKRNLRDGLISERKVKKNEKVTIIDIKLPEDDFEMFQNVINDDILSKSINEKSKKYYIYVNSRLNQMSTIEDYISKLYSKFWNEAVQKGLVDIECYIFDKKSNLKDIKNICQIFSYDSDFINNFTNPNDIKFLNTNDICGSLIESLATYSGKIYFLDYFTSHPRFNTKIYKTLAMGGTFDKLHNGHRKLLTLASHHCSQKLIIGVMGNKLLQNKSNFSLIDDYSLREASVKKFCFAINSDLNYDIFELQDPYGPTIHDDSIEAIIVSSETIQGAIKINEIRQKKGLKPLDILVTYRTDSAILSSTFLRNMK